MVFLWDGLNEEGRKECERVFQTRKDSFVWSRTRPTKVDRKPRGFENMGKTALLNEARRSMECLKQKKG
jgi:hypothetical protein